MTGRKRINPTLMTEYPSHLRNILYKDFYNGQIRVYKNGQIFRKNKRGIVEAPQHPTGVGRRYLMISVMKKGKQKHKYVHRLLAKAFIPNPENKPQINHKDGNPSNNDLSNLEWVTQKENVAHAYKTGLKPSLKTSELKCIKCKGTSLSEETPCADCRAELTRLKVKLKSKQEQRNKYRDINTEILQEGYAKIIKGRFRGDTLQELGDRFGVSRERIRQMEESVFDKELKVYKTKGKENMIEELNSRKKEPVPLVITLAAARTNKSKTIAQISKKLNVATTTVRGWELGRTKIPADKFEELLEIYEVPPQNIKGHFEGNWYRAAN